MNMRNRTRRNRAQKGNAMAALIVAVVLCSAVSASVVVTNTGRQREANADFRSERAFQLAEAGIDWAIADLRTRAGKIPNFTAPDVHSEAGVGTFALRYAQGNSNNRDDNGDGRVDEPQERFYSVVTSTGESGGVRRSIEVIVLKNVQVPVFAAGLQFNVDDPILDISGNAFQISGNNHRINGATDTTGGNLYGVSSPATTTELTTQIPRGREDNITGMGGDPSVTSNSPMDLDALMAAAQNSASTVLTAGTYSGVDFGTPTVEGSQVVYANGDVTLAGGSSGSGVLAVDGDLTISGGFEWIGLIIVRGRVSFDGGGATQRLVGAMIVGEEVTSVASTTEIGVSGTVDVLYSNDAVTMAAERLAMVGLVSWRQVANP